MDFDKCIMVCIHHFSIIRSSSLPYICSMFPLFNPPSSLTPGNNLSVPHLHNFVISRILYKQIHIQSSLSKLPFSTQHNNPEVHPSCSMYQYIVMFLDSIPNVLSVMIKILQNKKKQLFPCPHPLEE